MAFDIAKEWEAQGDSGMLERLRSDAPPESLSDCRRDQQWSSMYRMYAEKNFANENIEFLDRVDAFRASPNSDAASKIYDDYVRSGVLNLFARQGLDDIFKEEVLLVSEDMFNEAFDEIYNLTNQDSYSKFKAAASKVKRELAESDRAASDEGNAQEPEVEVGRPEKVELTRERIDDSVVDAMNERSLKDLEEGFSTNFWQLDDLVIIAWAGPTDEQPYVPWIKTRVPRPGTITMKKKGGAFSPGVLAVKISGVSDRSKFETAIARVSKKKVEYE